MEETNQKKTIFNIVAKVTKKTEGDEKETVVSEINVTHEDESVAKEVVAKVLGISTTIVANECNCHSTTTQNEAESGISPPDDKPSNKKERKVSPEVQAKKEERHSQKRQELTKKWRDLNAQGIIFNYKLQKDPNRAIQAIYRDTLRYFGGEKQSSKNATEALEALGISVYEGNKRGWHLKKNDDDNITPPLSPPSGVEMSVTEDKNQTPSTAKADEALKTIKELYPGQLTPEVKVEIEDNFPDELGTIIAAYGNLEAVWDKFR